MTERPFVLLTQEDCPNCERLKKMLAGPLRGTFDGQIEVVHRQSDPDAFEEQTRLHGLQSVPVLIHRISGAALLGSQGLGEIKRFLQTEVPSS